MARRRASAAGRHAPGGRRDRLQRGAEGASTRSARRGTYQFEYGSSALYGARTPAQPLGAGQQSVSAPVDGLRPFQTYHYRLLVTTALGTVSGPDVQLATRGDVRDPKVGSTCPLPPRPAHRSCDGWRDSAAAWRTLTGTAFDVCSRLLRAGSTSRAGPAQCGARPGSPGARRRGSCSAPAPGCPHWVIAWLETSALDARPAAASGGAPPAHRAGDDRAGNAEDAILTVRIRS